MANTLSREVLEELWWRKAASPVLSRRLAPSNPPRPQISGGSDISVIVAEFAEVMRRRIAEIDQEIVAQYKSRGPRS